MTADAPGPTATPDHDPALEPALDTARDPATGPAGPGPVPQRYGASFWIGLALGWAIMAYALRGVFDEYGNTNPPQLVRWVIGAAVLHDLLLAPVVTALAVVLAKVLPRWARGPVIGALALSALVAVFSVPLVRTFGRRELNSSTLPLDYGRNVVIVIVGIWLVAAVMVVVRGIRGRR